MSPSTKFALTYRVMAIVALAWMITAAWAGNWAAFLGWSACFIAVHTSTTWGRRCYQAGYTAAWDAEWVPRPHDPR